jgi:hypothetical protein
VSLPIPEVEWTPRDRVIGTLHLPDGISYELIDEGRPFGFARALEGVVEYEFADDEDESE